MSKLNKLASLRKLNKKDVLELYTKLGYRLPTCTKKETILQVLEENVIKDALKTSTNVISLDMGLKNMSLSHLTLQKNGELELNRWYKRDLEPDSNFQFNPINYAQITSEFLHNEILKYSDSTTNPLTVVFERQRFRTGGGSSVLESTLKTNTIEAMLCMGITYNNMETDIETRLESSPPGTMVKYWQNFYSGTNKKDSESKSFRINLILSMLYQILKDLKLLPSNLPHTDTLQKLLPKFRLSKTIVDGLSNAASHQNWMNSWNKAWSFKSETRRLFEVGYLLNSVNLQGVQDIKWGVLKGDDLADSLLHGITHFEYVSNRKKLHQVMELGLDIKSSFLM